MNSKKIKNINTFVYITLGLIIGFLFFKNLDLKWQIIYLKSTPDVELINYMSFDSEGVATGSLTGFVLFDDKEKQPKDFRQYVEIRALEYYDNAGNQLFSLTDIIKMDTLPPSYFDPILISVKNITEESVTLADSGNNLYIIDRDTNEVSMFDNTRDVARLVTKDLEFRQTMRSLLKK